MHTSGSPAVGNRQGPYGPIIEDPRLLDAMVQAARGQPGIYRPGPYWEPKTRAAVRQVKKHGLSAFRSDGSGVGTSYADNQITDVRWSLDTRRGRPLKLLFERVFPFSRIMDAQVALTRGFARDEAALAAGRITESDETRDLLGRYELPDTLLGGCVATAIVEGQAVSCHYLRALQLIDRARSTARLDEARSLMEIGGGFGANVHLQLAAFPKLRKVVYLDVPPNLYVGTCYLRTIYGDAVRDSDQLDERHSIGFSDDDSLEILAICPWQIEQLDLKVDVFWNANSFVEMPAEIVSNYARKVLGLPGSDQTRIVLSTYGGGGADTLAPTSLPAAFPGRAFAEERFWSLGWPIPARSDPERDAIWEVLLFLSTG